MQWLESPLWPKDLGFKLFSKLSFYPQMKWMKKNSQSRKRFKLLPRKQPCSQKNEA